MPFYLIDVDVNHANGEQCAKWGVEADLIRFSVGLEETSKLVDTFKRALDAMVKASSS